LFFQLILKGKIKKNGYRENLSDVDVAVKNELINIFHDDIRELEKITGRNLSAWVKKYET